MNFKVNNLIYAAGADMINTHRTEVTLKEPVNPQIMEKALCKAAVRFPYFSVRLKRQGEEYILEPNALPFVLSPEGGTVTLGTAESNFHVFAFAWDGCRFYMGASHFITDGNGVFPFLKTILYYYLSFLHPDERFDTKQIALSGDPVSDGEADDDPYPKDMLPANPIGNLSRPEQIFMLEDQPKGYESMAGWTSFRYIIPQKELMGYVSSIDGSPASFVASLLYRVLTSLYPENRLPIVCGMQHQFRKALGRPFSHLCHVKVVPMVYPDRIRDAELETLNTISRGILIIRANDDNDALTVNEHIRNERMIRGMTIDQKHEYMKKAVLDGIGKNTYEVSYTGRVPWSGLDRYIENLVPYLDMTLSGGISVEIFSVGEVFSVNIMQRNDDSRYADAFSKLLRENRIQYTAEKPERFRLCGFQLPDY
ncbi:MAG: hypothetical protein IKH57_11700 [Clostridia bacterium]|nr:hypothetical protein [Clostridia bacterium]